ncbi:hypothetical protein Ae201684P_001816 [Aphanomyces euteiches]|uniref:Uncharacterized protein n=1 Tax=Aphanomyces euteiches TaxID=100861 RepID=A0A6G0XL01_9STRA|nr:hypothetical protein Ae201684_003667 [Aphanomyces euteiches]KAH9084574.1 hypothetical protein Ae201684P_001816 [Aphanomyces euteiches]
MHLTGFPSGRTRHQEHRTHSVFFPSASPIPCDSHGRIRTNMNRIGAMLRQRSTNCAPLSWQTRVAFIVTDVPLGNPQRFHRRALLEVDGGIECVSLTRAAHPVAAMSIPPRAPPQFVDLSEIGFSDVMIKLSSAVLSNSDEQTSSFSRTSALRAFTYDDLQSSRAPEPP